MSGQDRGQSNNAKGSVVDEVFTLAWDQPDPGALVVRVWGAVDVTSARRMREGIAAARDAGETAAGRVVIDLREVSFLDSAGLAVLVETASQCDQAGQTFVLVVQGNAVLRPLQLTGLDKILTVTTSVVAALEAAGVQD